MPKSPLRILMLIRAALVVILLLVTDYILNLDTSLIFLIPASVIGVACGMYLASRNLRLLGLLTITIFTIIAYRLLFSTLNYFAPNSDLFLFIKIFIHLNLIGLIFLVNTWLAFLILRIKFYATAEIFIILSACITFFALHQNYRFDLVKVVNDLAWNLGYPPLGIITSIGFLVIALLTSYLFLIGNIVHENQGSQLVFNQIKSERKFKLFNSISFIILLSLFLIITKAVYQFHQIKYEVAVQNGVGSSNETGVSPLNFDSALGGSNQPAALVRLENDYLENPHSPMLYLRESALSELKSNELVLAKPEFDLDITRSNTHETFLRKNNSLETTLRQEINQKIYLLGDHKLAFGLDYPISIRPLKLIHKDQNFKAAYQVISLAPSYNNKQIINLELGNPAWNKDTWEHYTKKHQDPRYQELAIEISKDAVSRIDSILALTNYLNKNAIYTLKPNHNLSKEEDPTAKFLFGDLRGYCVHFAHATVYMLRALDIPSRIATGYMTDLSQAKDGHILLRMSDRHAWAEVYLDTIGWVPFDTQPEQVESHAETPVDQNLLSNLIDLLGTDEEIIDEDLLDPELKEEEQMSKILNYFKLKIILGFLLLVLGVLYLIKVYLLLGWTCYRSSPHKLKLIFNSLVFLLQDLGYQRSRGETKLDYLKRLQLELPAVETNLGETLNKIIYNLEHHEEYDPSLEKLVFKTFYSLKPIQKATIILNPFSVFSRELK